MKLLVLCRFVLLACLFVSSLQVSAAINVRTYVPKNASVLLPVVKSETERIFPNIPIAWYMGSLIEQESCISLTHSRCWQPTSQLKTSREEGAGLFQLTKAYTKTGGLRFDTLSDLVRKYPGELQELKWNNVYKRPDLQIRAGIILVKENYKALHEVKSSMNRLAMADSAYNGGLGNLQKSRRVCGLQANCNPQLWFDNVEKTLVQSRAAIYGNRSPNDINKEHVRNVFTLRLKKYRPYF